VCCVFVSVSASRMKRSGSFNYYTKNRMVIQLETDFRFFWSLCLCVCLFVCVTVCIVKILLSSYILYCVFLGISFFFVQVLDYMTLC